MPLPTQTGLARLASEGQWRRQLAGRIGYLCHSASVNEQLEHGAAILKRLFGERLRALFAPQHGLATDAQDNMIESPHFFHRHFQLPVHSLYAETRSPTPEMLAGIDHLLIDLQDNGVRVYTYIWTMVLAIEACGKAGIPVTILDRPNPLSGQRIEGNMSELEYRSLIGWLPLPMRHGMTAGEIARFALKYWNIDCELQVLPMLGWQRSMSFEATGLPWVLPSPNFPSLDTAGVYPGTVLFEGTNLSEGRGTVRPFELIGHPQLDPYRFVELCHSSMEKAGLRGCRLRPATFVPTFDKYEEQACNGFQVHITDRKTFRPWLTGQLLLRELYRELGRHFTWREPPFEYVYDLLPIDLLNGSEQPRLWVEGQGGMEELLGLEAKGREAFLEKRKEVLLYREVARKK